MAHKIGIVGLGYVGAPLAKAFSRVCDVVGYDLEPKKIRGVKTTTEVADLIDCNIYIIAVPTPVTKDNIPDLGPLLDASTKVGLVLMKGDTVIYESTVYPGCTEEDCVPKLESVSGKKFNKDFFVGYSPERINPGDKKHTLTNTIKITSGSTPGTAKKVDNLYKKITTTHLAPSIRVAEAAKAVENAQRDVNIAFVNELAIMLDNLDISTKDVLKAAGTKWNFHNYKPGLVGGHCIGVDPYYLTYRSQREGYRPEIISASRQINDKMGCFVAEKVIRGMIGAGVKIKGARALILGISFKANCPDIRNSRVIDIYNKLQSYGVHVDVFDPVVDKAKVKKEYGINLIDKPGRYDVTIHAVEHDKFKGFKKDAGPYFNLNDL